MASGQNRVHVRQSRWSQSHSRICDQPGNSRQFDQRKIFVNFGKCRGRGDGAEKEIEKPSRGLQVAQRKRLRKPNLGQIQLL